MKIKTSKKIISLVLCLSMVMSLVTTAFAAESSNGYITAYGVVLDFNPANENILDALSRANPLIDLSKAVVTEEVDSLGNVIYVVETAKREVFNEATLADIAPAFLDDPMANAQLIGNTLTYTLPDGTLGTIVETIDQFDRRTLKVTEGELTNEIIFDSANNQILVDGETTVTYLNDVFVIQQNMSARWSPQWTFFMQTNVDLRAQQAISLLTVATIVAIVSAALTRNISIGVGIGTAIREAYQRMRPQHDQVYITRRMYHDPMWIEWRYVDSFYTWNARTATQRITSRTLFLTAS